jgi:hypothetical protein
MAEKPTKKPRKTTSSANGKAQTKSTVTPINAGKGGETHNRVPQPSAVASAAERKIADHKIADHKTADHKIANQEVLEQIRIRAYELFEQRGRHEGHHHEDWVRAEVEILAKFQRDKSA